MAKVSPEMAAARKVFGAFLRDIRTSCGLKQREVCAKAGISQLQHYNAIERGRRQCGRLMAAKLIEAYQLTGKTLAIFYALAAPTAARKPRQKFAEMSWAPEDVQTLRPRMPIHVARAFLHVNEKRLRDRLIELGWEIMRELLTYEEAERGLGQ